MLNFKREILKIAIPIMLANLIVTMTILINARIVSFNNSMNWYCLAYFLPVSYLIVGILESGRVCAIVAISKVKLENVRKICSIFALYYTLPILLCSVIVLIVIYGHNGGTLSHRYQIFMLYYVLSYIVVSTSSIFNAGLFALKKSTFAATNIIITSFLSIIITYISYHRLKLDIFGLIYANVIPYSIATIVAMRYLPKTKISGVCNYYYTAWKLCKNVGAPLFVNYIFLPIALYMINNILTNVGQDMASGVSISYRLQDFILLPAISIGVASGIIFNHLTEDKESGVVTFNLVLLNLLLYVPTAIIFFFIRNHLSGFFTSNSDIQQTILGYLTYLPWTYIVFCPFISYLTLLEQTGSIRLPLMCNVSIVALQVVFMFFIVHMHYKLEFFYQMMSVMLVLIPILVLQLSLNKRFTLGVTS